MGQKAINIRTTFIINLLPKIFKNRPIWSHWASKFLAALLLGSDRENCRLKFYYKCRSVYIVGISHFVIFFNRYSTHGGIFSNVLKADTIIGQIFSF